MYFREQRKANGVCIITEGGKYFPGIGVGGGKCTYVLGFVCPFTYLFWSGRPNVKSRNYFTNVL